MPHVDLLRALAITSVVLYHAGFPYIDGGFLGVDVFFVISGYLITAFIVKDLTQATFSLRDFYYRRIRRLVPAFITVATVTLTLSYFWLLPDELLELTNSVMASVFFVSNVFFWRKSGYFESFADEQPFLHTWSLGLEEQFYIILPLILIFFYRSNLKSVFVVFTTLFIVSLSLAIYASINMPVANFYLLPTRAWEFFAGGLAALFVSRKAPQKNHLLSYFGLSLIIFSMFYFDHLDSLPNQKSLFPVIGSILFLLFGNIEVKHAKQKLTKLFILVGLISYPLYLWHQPVFALYKIRFSPNVSVYESVMLILVSVCLSILTYVIVENPIRRGLRTPTIGKYFLGFLYFLVILFCLASIFRGGKLNPSLSEPIPFITWTSLEHRISSDGLPCDWNAKILDYNGFTGCIMGDRDGSRSLVLVGDSHSQALSYEINRQAEIYGTTIYWLKVSDCNYFPMVTLGRSKVAVDCMRNHHNMLDYISGLNADVMLAYRWTFRLYPVDGSDINMPYIDGNGNVEKENYREFYIYENGLHKSDLQTKSRYLKNYINDFINVSNSVYLVYPIPETSINPYKSNILHRAQTNHLLDDITFPVSDYDQRNKLILSILDSIESESLNRIKPRDSFCFSYTPGKCYVQYQRNPLYLDDDHVSDFGASRIINRVFASD